MTTPFRTRRRVEFVDTDTAGIVHFSNFFRYMEAAEVDFLQSLGLSVSMQTADGRWIGFPRVSATCDYIKPAKFLDIVEVVVKVEKIGGKSVTYEFDFEKQGELIARGRITAVCCMTTPDHKLESLEIPADIRRKLQGE
ncbi:MAG: acyl-CoA thioesterase [Planctomycetia bacterium]|nr:acyl-CoA thioesterase [Planctomycetia bacterium]